ncbi:MAG: DUF885 domain-containing protein [Planctomycetes bacterium]|nr:DUF885 domain-containing protein [Planctomycetota bacterium]
MLKRTAALVCTLAACAIGQDASPGVRVIPQRPQGTAGAPAGVKNPPNIAQKIVARSGALLTLLDEHVDFLMREDPLWASRRGDERFNDQLRDESPAAYARRLEEMRARFARLKALDRSGFTEEDALDADLLEYELTLAIDGAAFYPEQMPVNSLDGPHVTWPQMCDMVPVRTAKQLSDYATRLTKVGALADQLIEQMRAGLAAKRTPPRGVLKNAVAGCLAQCGEQIAADPTQSPFYRPFRAGPADAPAAVKAREAIGGVIVPAYRKLAAFLKDEYIPGCAEGIAYSEGVDGPAAYAYKLRFYTTTPAGVEDVHKIGLREVARLRAEMIAGIAETDFAQKNSLSGDALLGAFLEYLRTDPRFYFTKSEEMMAGYRDIAKRIDPELPKLFRTLPRNTYGVREIPRFAAATSPAAYCYNGSIRSGVPGYFMVNASNLSQRPRYGMISLTMHEAVPGHHFQLSIADELDAVHTFRTLTSYTAYVEGWALYCEKLGLEMDPGAGLRRIDGGEGRSSRGFYADPYDNFGRLSDEIWRAARLVVDTGMHAKGWTRERAVKYMLDNTAGTTVDIESEIDRYISWPGQACAYKLGELSISGLRANARQRLGENFDLRAFHDVVLPGGALPLPVLEKRVLRWTAAREKK